MVGQKKFSPPLLVLLLDPDPGSEIRELGWIKIRIWDRHPGPATLLKTFYQLISV